MAEHHDSGVTKLALLTEIDMLVRSISGFRGGGGHAETIKAVGDFLRHYHGGAGIPWVRMYKLFPEWQEQCGLLDHEWDSGAVLKRASVVFTLINTHGATIRRLALGGGTWKGTGAETIGNEFVLTKLYYKRDGAKRPKEEGFTAFEFHLTMDLQPRVAICVLYRTDYRHLIRDMKEYIHEGYFRRGNQDNPQMVQHFGLINSAPIVGGLMNGPDQVDQTINQDFENEANYRQQSPVFLSEIPPPVALHGLPYGVDQFPENDQMTESFGYNLDLPGNSLNWPMNGDQYYMSQTAYHASSENPVMSLSNTQPMNGNPYDTTPLPEQDAPNNQVSTQNESSISSFGNSMGTPNWNAMTSGNQLLQPDSFPRGEDLVSTTQNYSQTGHLSFTAFSEHYSTFETYDNGPIFLEPFPPNEYYSATTANNYIREGYDSLPF